MVKNRKARLLLRVPVCSLGRVHQYRISNRLHVAWFDDGEYFGNNRKASARQNRAELRRREEWEDRQRWEEERREDFHRWGGVQ